MVRMFASTFIILSLTLSHPAISFSEKNPPDNSWPDAPSIYIQVDTKTWKTRGRMFWDVEGSLKKKLASTGFIIVRNEETQHQLTLTVLYSETQGAEYDIKAYGTNIHATITLTPPPQHSPWELKISESSSNLVSGTPPYLDVLDKFQTNPYYFFIEEILRGSLEQGLDPRGGLIFAIERVALRRIKESPPPIPIGRDAGSHLHTMETEKEVYETRAINRGIDDFVNAKDPRIVPILTNLLKDPDSGVRIRTIEAIGSLRIKQSRQQLLDLAKNDPDSQVRETAKAIERGLREDS